jgi:hypothetical protein
MSVKGEPWSARRSSIGFCTGRGWCDHLMACAVPVFCCKLAEGDHPREAVVSETDVAAALTIGWRYAARADG